jgi:NADPH:quinone reductase-like Zn-dependent oxidoreductase
VVERAFPLAQAGQAHEFMAKTGHIGKILLTL